MPERGVVLNFQTRGVIISNMKRQIAAATISHLLKMSVAQTPIFVRFCSKKTSFFYNNKFVKFT